MLTFRTTKNENGKIITVIIINDKERFKCDADDKMDTTTCVWVLNGSTLTLEGELKQNIFTLESNAKIKFCHNNTQYCLKNTASQNLDIADMMLLINVSKLFDISSDNYFVGSEANADQLELVESYKNMNKKLVKLFVQDNIVGDNFTKVDQLIQKASEDAQFENGQVISPNMPYVVNTDNDQVVSLGGTNEEYPE